MENKPLVEISFDQIADEYEKEGNKFAISCANWEMKDESKKSVLAKCATKYEGTEASKERLARIDNEFKEYLKDVAQSRKEMLTLKVRMDALQMNFKYHQSINANNRNNPI